VLEFRVCATLSFWPPEFEELEQVGQAEDAKWKRIEWGLAAGA